MMRCSFVRSDLPFLVVVSNKLLISRNSFNSSNYTQNGKNPVNEKGNEITTIAEMNCEI